MLAGAEGLPDGEGVEVSGGTYMVFPAKGPMPEAVILAWQQIWAFFADETAPKRIYDTDFEKYTGEEDAAIYIGIEG